MEWFWIVTIVASIVIVIGLIVYSIVRFSGLKSATNAGLEHFRERLGAFTPDAVHQGEEGGVAYWYSYVPAKNKQPSSLRVWVEARSGGSFKLTREGWFDRLGQSLGICCEIKTGDEEFDRAIYITTDYPQFAAAAFAGPSPRQAAVDVLDKNFTEINHDGSTISATVPAFQPKEDMDPSFIPEAGVRLAFLAQGLPQEVVETAPGGAGSRLVVKAVPWVLGALFLGLALWPPYPAVDMSEAFLPSLTYSLLAMAVFLLLALVMIRGRSTSHTELLLVTIFTIPAFVLFGWQTMIFFNGQLDDKPSSRHELLVVRKDIHRSTGKNRSTTYYAYLQPWRRGEGEHRLNVGQSLYNQLIPNTSRAVLVTKPGHFGYEWYVSKDYVIRPAAPLPKGPPPIQPPALQPGPNRPDNQQAVPQGR